MGSSFWASLGSLLRQHEVDESIITRLIPAQQNDEKKRFIMDRLLTMAPSEAYRFVLQPKIQMETSKRLSCELSKGIFNLLKKYRQELSDELSGNTEDVWELYEELVSEGYVSSSEDQYIRPEKYNNKRHKKRPSSSTTRQSRKRTKKQTEQNKTQTNDALVTIQDMLGDLADRPLRVFPSLPKPSEACAMSEREITGICVLQEAYKLKSSRKKDLLGYTYMASLSTDESVVYLNDNDELWIGVKSSPFQTLDTAVTYRMIRENVPVIQHAIQQLSPQRVYMIGRNEGAVVVLIAGKTVLETSFIMTIGAPLSISVRSSAFLGPSDALSLSFPTAMLSGSESNFVAAAATTTTTTTTTTGMLPASGSGSESSASEHQPSRNADIFPTSQTTETTQTTHTETGSTLTLSTSGGNSNSNSGSGKRLGSDFLSPSRADGSSVVVSTGNVSESDEQLTHMEDKNKWSCMAKSPNDDDDGDTDSDTDMSGIEEVFAFER